MFQLLIQEMHSERTEIPLASEGENMKIWYEAVGEVRGSCGHRHRTAKAADRCCENDQRAIEIAYPSTYPTRAYSDRRVKKFVETDGVVEVQDLNDIEKEQLYGSAF